MNCDEWIPEEELYSFLTSIGIDVENIFLIGEGGEDVTFAIPNMTPAQAVLFEHFVKMGGV